MADTQVKNASLPANVFAVKVNTTAMHDVIVSDRAALRQGTHMTKTRAEVRGGGIKPWRQKGTGRARAGSIRSPQWVGGGVAWGPRTGVNYTKKVNKKVRVLAFNSALTLKAQDNAVLVHDFKVNEVPNTKGLVAEIKALNLDKKFKKILIVTNDAVVWKSASNLPKVFANKLSSLTVEAIVGADVVIFSADAMKKLEGKGAK